MSSAIASAIIPDRVTWFQEAIARIEASQANSRALRQLSQSGGESLQV